MRDEITKYAKDLLGESFKFRPGQLEAIEKIVENVVDDVKQTVLEAPTGSGKSVIGIVAAYVLYRAYGKTSYILASDLSLFEQYERDIKKLNGQKYFGYVKGKENYVCSDNGCPASQSTCSLRSVSVGMMTKDPSLLETKYSCAKSCSYVADYVRASIAPITLMTYQLYFIQRNYVEDSLMFGRNKNFPARDLVICDECHNLCSISQTHFAPKISVSKPQYMRVLEDYLKTPQSDDARLAAVRNIRDARDSYVLLDSLRAYEKIVAGYLRANDIVRSKAGKKKKLTRFDKAALFAGNQARQEHCKLEDMIAFATASASRANYLVKTLEPDNITVNYVFDDAMLRKYFHRKSKCELFMSATVGDFRDYARITGLDEASMSSITIEPGFDFAKSPIYVSASNKMSFAEKARSLPNIARQVDAICRMFVDCRGIIQTGSYANTEALKRMLSPDVLARCLFYRGAVDKRAQIDVFTSGSGRGKILVGPTLLEGLNFPDEMCRFQICVKVPYANLSNEYVKRKKQIMPRWYNYDVLNKLCQGIGRGVRHETDWCETYLLDGCASRLARDLERMPALRGRIKPMLLMTV